MKSSFDAYTAPLGEVLEHFSTSLETGLGKQVYEEVRKAEGPNTSSGAHGLFPLLLELVYLVPACAVAIILFRAGDMISGVLVASAAVVMAAGLYALVHHVLKAGARRQRLKAGMEHPVAVVRDGTLQQLSGRQLVPGDILVFDKHADVVLPADCRLVPGHDIRIRHSWQYAWLQGTQLDPQEDILMAGTELHVATGSAIVIATGDKRRIAAMYNDHPAGPMVRTLWHTGLWYLLAVVILLGGGFLQGKETSVAYALAIGIPVLLPFFFIKKGRGLRVQTTSNIPEHILYPVEQLLTPKPREARIIMKDIALPLRELKNASSQTQSTVGQFLELLTLCTRDEATRHDPLLMRLAKDARRQGLDIDAMESWTKDLEMSRTNFRPSTGTYCFLGSFIQRDDDQENSLHLACDDAPSLLAQCTYIWDAKEHTMRRRFFSGEKQQLGEILEQEAAAGHISYGLALRESEDPNASWIYIGAVVIPREVHMETLQELHSYAGNGHAVVFYSESAISPAFAKDMLKVPSKHIFTDAKELTFTNLRRNDFFLVSHIDAVQLRALHDRLQGAVLVDTIQDRFVSSIYFWPRFMRFDAAATPTFFGWLTGHTQRARDALTKSAQYACLLTLLVIGALALLLIAPAFPGDKLLLFCATTGVALGLIAIVTHITDEQTNPLRIQQLALLDVQQAMTGVRIALAGAAAGGAYLALVADKTLTLEFVFFVLVGIAAASLSRLAMDTPNIRQAILFAVAFLVLTIPVYLLFFTGNTLLAPDMQILFCAALLLGGLTWILASYQSLPQRGL